MEKGHNEDIEDQYPPEFEYLNGIVGEKISQLQLLNKQIKDIPKILPDEAKLQYDMPNLGKALRDAQNMKALSQLEHVKSTLEKEVKERIEAEIRNLDPEVAEQIRKVTDEKLYPNKFKGKSDVELDRIQPMAKDIDHSQDYMQVRIKNQRNGRIRPTENNTTTQENRKEKVSEEPKTFAGAQFLQNLNYTIKVDNGGNASKQVNPSKIKSGKDKMD